MTYSLQFRGVVLPQPEGLAKRATAPPCTLVTRLEADGVAARFIYGECRDEAVLRARVVMRSGESFSEAALVDFGHGHMLRLRSLAVGLLDDSPDPDLRHGSSILLVEGGAGQFEGASGRVASSFFVSTAGDLTDTQLGVVFLRELWQHSEPPGL